MKIRYTWNEVRVINYIDLCVGDYFICVYENGIETLKEYSAENIYMKISKGCVNLKGIERSFKNNEKVIKIEMEFSWREA